MKCSRAVLVTGATGLVGWELVDQLRRAGDIDVVGAARRPSAAEPAVVAWDMAKEPPPAQLHRHWDAVVNAAANTRWTMSPEEAVRANVDSVRALDPLVSDSTRVLHVSTAYANGLRGDGESAELEDYRNTYEWSKASSERVARETFSQLAVVRPPLIVGRRGDGRAARFSGMYTLVRGITVGTVPALVAEPAARFDAIPVDDLCRSIAELIDESRAFAGETVTIAGGPAAPTVAGAVAAIVSSLNAWRRSRNLPPVDQPPLIEPESWSRFFRPLVDETLTSRQRLIIELLGSFEPYLALAEPLRPDRVVSDVLPCLESSTRYWAEANPRIASLAPRPWKPEAAQRRKLEPSHA